MDGNTNGVGAVGASDREASLMTTVHADDGPATSLDESNIIALIRQLLPTSTGAAQRTSNGVAANGPDAVGLAPSHGRDQLPPTVGDAESREQAGTLLWDLSIIDGVASVMVHSGMILSVLEAVLAKGLMESGGGPEVGDPERPLEVALGILGNIAAHTELAGALAAQTSLLDLCVVALHTLSSTAALSELCRLASTALRKPGAHEWLQRLQDPAAAERLLWVARQARDATLHARTLDLVVALLHAEELQHQQQQQRGTAGSNGTRKRKHFDHSTGTAIQHGTGDTAEVAGGPDATPPAPTEDNPTGECPAAHPFPCAVNLVAAGLLALITDVLSHAATTDGEMGSGGSLAGRGDASWTDLTPGFARMPPTQPRHRCAPTPHLALTLSGTPQLAADRSDAADAPGDAAGGAAGGGDEPAAAPPLPISEAGLDAALRVVEELGALPPHTPEHAALLASGPLVEYAVGLLQCAPAEQVLESLLLALEALADPAVPVLASNIRHVRALLDCLGELPSDGDRGAWQREVVVWLLARTCQHMARAGATPADSPDSTVPAAAVAKPGSAGPSAGATTAPLAGRRRPSLTSPPQQSRLATVSESSPSRAPRPPPAPRRSVAGHAAAAGSDAVSAHKQEYLEAGQRISGLRDTCGISGRHVDGYLHAAARGMAAVLAQQGLAGGGAGRAVSAALERAAGST